MNREPIISDEKEEKEISVRLVKEPLSLKSLLPTYRYELDGAEVPEEANHMYSDLLEFLNTNEELAVKSGISSEDDYKAGFQRAIALVRLWIDSVYL